MYIHTYLLCIISVESNRSAANNLLLIALLFYAGLRKIFYKRKSYIGDFSEGDSKISTKIYLYPHLHFTIGYNGDQIVAIQISTDVRVLFYFLYFADSIGLQLYFSFFINTHTQTHHGS
jgi:hypothetical protein